MWFMIETLERSGCYRTVAEEATATMAKADALVEEAMGEEGGGERWVLSTVSILSRLGNNNGISGRER